MKSGIYKTPNGNLIYVAKDRTIKATTLSPSSWPGTKVSHRSKDDTVVIEGTDYRCTRFSDVPNGCTDHQKAVDDAKADFEERDYERQEQARTVKCEHRVSTVLTADAEDAIAKLRAQGYRPCYRQSARKHRRQGHTVLSVIGDDAGRRWWKAA